MSGHNNGLHAVSDRSAVNVDENVRAAWNAYRLRRTIALFLLFGWIPVTVAIFLLSQFWLHQPVLALALVLLWWMAACLAVWWAGEFRCPRCRRRYGALGSKKGLSALWRGLFDEICHNCKLRKFENFNAEGSNPGTLDRRVSKS